MTLVRPERGRQVDLSSFAFRRLRVSPTSASASRTRRELLVLHNLKRFAMYSDPMFEPTVESGDALSPLSEQPPPKEMTMKRYYYERLQGLSARAAAFAAAFATTATLLLAVGGAFYSVSSQPVLADSPKARSAIAGCDVLDDRVARQRCVRRLVAEAKAHHAGAAQLAALAARPRGARP
jgi:hypothetical protein